MEQKNANSKIPNLTAETKIIKLWNARIDDVDSLCRTLSFRKSELADQRKTEGNLQPFHRSGLPAPTSPQLCCSPGGVTERHSEKTISAEAETQLFWVTFKWNKPARQSENTWQEWCTADHSSQQSETVCSRHCPTIACPHSPPAAHSPSIFCYYFDLRFSLSFYSFQVTWLGNSKSVTATAAHLLWFKMGQFSKTFSEVTPRGRPGWHFQNRTIVVKFQFFPTPRAKACYGKIL